MVCGYAVSSLVILKKNVLQAYTGSPVFLLFIPDPVFHRIAFTMSCAWLQASMQP